MKVRSMQYYVREAIVNLFKNRLMTLASIITVASCVFMVTVSFCVAVNVDDILKQIENSIGLSVMLDVDISADRVNELHKTISEMSYVKSIDFVSSEEALQSFSEDLGDASGILAGLEKRNPLPSSFVLTVKDVKFQRELIRELEQLIGEGVTKVLHAQKIINPLVAIDNGIRVVSVAMILGLLVISIVIIMNTIRITMNSRRVEINIMKYVGATNWFIRWPFVIEGALMGLIGSVIPVLISMLGYNQAVAAIYKHFSFIEGMVEFKPMAYVFTFLMPITLFMGVGIGVFGSVTSIRKHLKV